MGSDKIHGFTREPRLEPTPGNGPLTETYDSEIDETTETVTDTFYVIQHKVTGVGAGGEQTSYWAHNSLDIPGWGDTLAVSSACTVAIRELTALFEVSSYKTVGFKSLADVDLAVTIIKHFSKRTPEIRACRRQVTTVIKTAPLPL